MLTSCFLLLRRKTKQNQTQSYYLQFPTQKQFLNWVEYFKHNKMVECLLYTFVNGYYRISRNCFYFREATLEKFAKGSWSASSHRIPGTRRIDFLQIILHMTPWYLNPLFAFSHIWKHIAVLWLTTIEQNLRHVDYWNLGKCFFQSLEHPVWSLSFWALLLPQRFSGKDVCLQFVSFYLFKSKVGGYLLFFEYINIFF